MSSSPPGPHHSVFTSITESACGEGGDAFCSLNVFIVTPVHLLLLLLVPYLLARLRAVSTQQAVASELEDSGIAVPARRGKSRRTRAFRHSYGRLEDGGLDEGDEEADADEVAVELPDVAGSSDPAHLGNRPSDAPAFRITFGLIVEFLVFVFLASYPAILLSMLRNHHNSFAGLGASSLASAASVHSPGAMVWGLSAVASASANLFVLRRYAAAGLNIPVALAWWWILAFLAHLPPAMLVVSRAGDFGELEPMEVYTVVVGIVLFCQAGVGVDAIVRVLTTPTVETAGVAAGTAASPEDRAGLLSRLLFTWVSPLMVTGFKRPLEATDVPPLSVIDTSHVVSRLFDREWRKEQKGKRSVAMALVRAFGPVFWSAVVFKLVHDVLLFAGPTLLRAIITFLNDTENEHHTDDMGLAYVATMCLAGLIQTMALHQYFLRVFRVGMHLRSAVILSVYRKALRLSVGARQQKSVGEIVNIMSTDARRMQELTTYLNMIWSAPLQITLSLYLLWDQLGAATLAGVTVMVCFIPFNGYVARLIKKLQEKLMKAKDKRVNMTNEALNGIKFIKLSAWEDDFEERVKKERTSELGRLRSYLVFSSLSGMLWQSVPILVALASFATYVAMGNQLTAAVAFPSLALFNILRFPMAMLPGVINNLIEASVSISRISSFLNAHEVDESATRRLPSPEGEPDAVASGGAGAGDRDDVFGAHEELPPAIEVERGNFKWPTTEEVKMAEAKGVRLCGWCRKAPEKKAEATDDSKLLSDAEEGAGESKEEEEVTPAGRGVVSDVNLRIEAGSLVCVVGQVASGKSSLLQALLGEMNKLSGNVTVRGKVAYVAQTAFILNATLRDNVTFGLEYDEERFRAAVRVTCLQPDIDMLPAREDTEIGERGINLSGGQRQRVSMARAVYADADIYLLDDPLSAVDAHVGNTMFEQCLATALRGKTRVLVTHALQYVHSADSVIVMADGRIAEHGTYTELSSKRDSILSGLLRTFSAETGELVGSGSGEGADEAPAGTEGDEGAEVTVRRRTSTAASAASAKSKELSPAGAAAGQLVKDEKLGRGGVAASVYKDYVSASGGKLMVGIALLFYAGKTGSRALLNWYLSYWSSAASDDVTDSSGQTGFLGVYSVLALIAVSFTGGASLFLALRSLRSAKTMHENLLHTILRAPMSFFDTTPIGRVLNRFSGDIYTLDEELMRTFNWLFSTSFEIVGTVILIGSVTPVFLVGVAPLVAFYLFTQRYYVRTSRELKRLESVSKSPIFAHFGETLSGTVTVRAFRSQERFATSNESKLDANQAAFFATQASNRWLAVRLELVGIAIITTAALFAVLEKGSIDPALAGLSISYALSVTQTLNWMVRMTSEAESKIVAVERVNEYAKMATEPREEEGRKPPHSWPTEGALAIRNLRLKYRPGLPEVLRGITCDIKGGEKIGVCGRTGAGKSSFVAALFRLADEQKGLISIDGEDISALGLKSLRSRLAIIPQDTVLFTGTLRQNLDPLDRLSSEQLYDALDNVGIGDVVRGMSDGLDSEVTENGENWSHGQRQLICMARALLRRSRIVVLDEATAATDIETDALLQRTIRTVFADCTVMTIAHRVNTILDSDRIIVMEKGEIAEFDAPSVLLAKPDGLFRALVSEASQAASAANDAAEAAAATGSAEAKAS